MFVGALTKLNLALVLALCFANSATATLNMNNICLLVGDGYNIASEDSCNNYYYCSGGLATMQSCGPSLYFSKDQQTCLSPSQVNCAAVGDVPCAGRQIGTWAAMPNSCSGYYYCGANGPLAGYCPGGENFDSVSQSCQYNTVVGCSSLGGGSSDGLDGGATPSINLCNFIQSSVYFGNPSDCTGWNTCSNNIMSSGFCNNNLVFNVHKRTCDYASDWTSCSQVTHDPNLVNSTATTGGSCTAQDPLTKNTTLCDSYYLCDGTTYQLTQCPSGLYFDTISQSCVDRMDAHNNCDRCEGTTKSFVNAYSTQNCTGYLSCLNGVQQSSGTCPSGYFDEEAGACLVNGKEPTYACCNPNPNGVSSTTVAGSNCTSTDGSTVSSDCTTPVATTLESTTPESTTLSTTTPLP